MVPDCAPPLTPTLDGCPGSRPSLAPLLPGCGAPPPLSLPFPVWLHTCTVLAVLRTR